MTNHISILLRMAADAMQQGQTLDDLQAPFTDYVLNNMLDDHDAHDQAAALACGLSRAIWRAMPNPSQQFQIEKLPSLGRNDPCAIGLGCKHKQCCGGMPAFVGINSERCWSVLCKELPASSMQDIVDSERLPVGMLGYVALRLLDIDPDRARMLLEPYFAGKLGTKDKSAEGILSLLCDAYDLLGQSHLKIALLERVLVEAGGQLRADALHRLATVYSDRGDYKASWKCYAEAERIAPNDPALSHLQIMLLLSQKRFADARERALYWTNKLQRAGYDEHSLPVMGWLREIARGDNPDQALANLISDRLGEWETRLIAAVLAGLAAPPQSQYLQVAALANRSPATPQTHEQLEATIFQSLINLGASKESAREESRKVARDIAALPGSQPADALTASAEDTTDAEMSRQHVIVTDASMREREQEWHRAWPLGKPMSTDSQPKVTVNVWASPHVEFWVGFIEQHTDALNSLDILDDLSMALATMPSDDGHHAAVPVRENILNRAQTLLATVTAADIELPWHCTENRSALRLLVEHAYSHLNRDEADTMALLQNVLRLNPNDNHGLRDLVINRHLEDGADEAALSVINRYPGDLSPAPAFGKVLALYRLGRMPEARAAVSVAKKHNRKIAKFLLPEYKAEPALSPHHIQVGGDDEAWCYREDMRRVWEAVPGALDWLKKNAG